MKRWRYGDMKRWRDEEVYRWRGVEMKMWRDEEMERWRDGDMERCRGVEDQSQGSESIFQGLEPITGDQRGVEVWMRTYLRQPLLVRFVERGSPLHWDVIWDIVRSPNGSRSRGRARSRGVYRPLRLPRISANLRVRASKSE
eukprot:739300-Prorocentrum_minimum.AAC.1